MATMPWCLTLLVTVSSQLRGKLSLLVYYIRNLTSGGTGKIRTRDLVKSEH
jgi:hypothetical protein